MEVEVEVDVLAVEEDDVAEVDDDGVYGVRGVGGVNHGRVTGWVGDGVAEVAVRKHGCCG